MFEGVSNVSSTTDRVFQCSEYTDCEQSAHRLASYLIPVVFLCGVVGNSLTIIVYGRRKNRGTSSGVYLCSMSTANIGVYIFGLVPLWLSVCEFWVYSDTVWSCRFVRFLHETSRTATGWLLVAFTCVRMFVVCYPLRSITTARVSRLRTTIATTLLLVVLAAALNLHLFWTAGSTNNDCFHCFDSDFKFFQSDTEWLTVILTYGLPFCAILVFNALIIRTLRQRGSLWVQLPKSMTTVLCVSASFVYCIFAVPALVMSLIKASFTEVTCDYIITEWISYSCIYIGYMTNFFVYCLSSKQFRNELVGLVRGSSRRPSGTPTVGLPMTPSHGGRGAWSMTTLTDAPSIETVL